MHTDPPKLVGFWIPLEDATIENGCLWFSKGSHKSGVHRRYVRNNDANSQDLLIYTSPAPFYQKSGFKPVPVKKGLLPKYINMNIENDLTNIFILGSCVLIHGQVVHFSEANKSNKSRHAYTFHVIEGKNTKYSEDNWLQPSKEKPFLNLYKN